MVLIPMV
nr:unnamed protein product [Callosobruchus analis]